MIDTGKSYKIYDLGKIWSGPRSSVLGLPRSLLFPLDLWVILLGWHRSSDATKAVNGQEGARHPKTHPLGWAQTTNNQLDNDMWDFDVPALGSIGPIYAPWPQDTFGWRISSFGPKSGTHLCKIGWAAWFWVVKWHWIYHELPLQKGNHWGSTSQIWMNHKTMCETTNQWSIFSYTWIQQFNGFEWFRYSIRAWLKIQGLRAV